MFQPKAPQVGHNTGSHLATRCNPSQTTIVGSRSSLKHRRQRLLWAHASSVDVTPHRKAPHMENTAEHVPSELGDALWTFARHPSTVLAATAIGMVLLGAVALWVVQEHAIHKYLLHSSFPWLGKSVHEAHHAKPYYHVSIDGPELVVPFMAVAGLVFYCLLQGNLPLTASACTGYYTSGLLGYQLIHYLAHTRWVPKAPLLRSLRRHHQLHHLRNYDHWFAFCLPAMDTWLGTAPQHPSQVPFKMMAGGGAGRRPQSQPKARQE